MSNQMADRDPLKIRKEAEVFLKKGENSRKGGFFSKPNPESAADYFSRAGQKYIELMEAGGEPNDLFQAKYCFEAAGDMWDQANLQAKAGEYYVNAAKAALQRGEVDDMARLMELAKLRFLEDDKPLQIARYLREAAQKAREKDPGVAADLYRSFLSLIEETHNFHWEKESFVDYAILCLQMKDWENCASAWMRARESFRALKYEDGMAHCVVSLAIIHLSRGDVVAAESLIEEEIQQDYFIRSKDYEMIDYVIRGVKNRDGDVLELGQKSIVLGFLKPEIARLVAAFRAPKRGPDAQSQYACDEEEEEVDLC